jgi:hypothetical protein
MNATERWEHPNVRYSLGTGMALIAVKLSISEPYLILISMKKRRPIILLSGLRQPQNHYDEVYAKRSSMWF